MKHEIFIIAVLHLTSVAKSLPPPKSADTLKLQERLEPRDLTYDLSFGWFGTNENEGVLNPGIKIASQIHENSKTETVQSLLRALEEESKHADSEQQKKILSLIQVLLNNVWHTIDMGVFGSTQRLRTKMTAEKFIDKLKKLILQILELFYQYFTQNGTESPKYEETYVGQGQSDDTDPWEVEGGSERHSDSEQDTDSDSLGPTGGPGVEVEGKEYGSGSSTSETDVEKGSDEDVGSGPGSGLGSGRGSGRGSGTGSAPATNKPDSVGSGESGSSSTENGNMSEEILESSDEKSSTHGPSGVEAGSSGTSSENPSSGELGGRGNGLSSSEEPPSVELGKDESSGDNSRRGSLGGSTTPPHSGEAEMKSSGEGFSESYDSNVDMMKGTGNTNRPCPPQVKLTP